MRDFTVKLRICVGQVEMYKKYGKSGRKIFLIIVVLIAVVILVALVAIYYFIKPYYEDHREEKLVKEEENRRNQEEFEVLPGNVDINSMKNAESDQAKVDSIENYLDIIMQSNPTAFSLYDLDKDGNLELITQTQDQAAKVMTCVYDTVDGNVVEIISDLWAESIAISTEYNYLVGYGTLFFDRYFLYDCANGYDLILLLGYSQVADGPETFGDYNLYVNAVNHSSALRFVQNTEDNRKDYIEAGKSTGIDDSVDLSFWIRNMPH